MLGFCRFCHFDVRRHQQYRFLGFKKSRQGYDLNNYVHETCFRKRRLKGLLLIALVAVLVLASASAFAYHEDIPVLRGTIPFATAVCHFNHKGEMTRFGTIEKPCVLVADPNNLRYVYAVVQDKNGNVVEVVKMDGEQKEPNKSVWKKGAEI